MIHVNTERAEQVLGTLLLAYRQKRYPFDQPEAVPPQIRENLPESLIWGSREHGLFLFALCYWMRGGIKSHVAIRQLTRLYNHEPAIFLPENEEDWDAASLTDQFNVVHLGFNAEQTGQIWKQNLKTLRTLWESDPRNLFQGISTYEEACARIQNRRKSGFKGFQEKMVSMLAYFFMHADMIDRWDFPIPVDFHVLRTIFAHEILTVESEDGGKNGFYTKPVLATVRELLLNYCKRHNVDPIELCDAVWLYSGIMCSQYAGNQSSEGSSKRNGRRTIIHPIARWTSAQTRRYERTCAVCVVRATCTWTIPAAAYYVGGRLELRERHESPDQGSFFPVFNQTHQKK